MDWLIKKLETLRNEARYKAQYGNSYFQGQYVAYHRMVELLKQDSVTGVNRCVCCGEIIPEGGWVCPQCSHKE